MNALNNPTTILITGATGSIGGALALAYAAPGKTLVLQGRNEVRLGSLIIECEALGAKVITHAVDLRNRQAVTDWLYPLCESIDLDLVIINAGMNTDIGPKGEGELWQEVEALIEVNVLSAMLISDTVLPKMRQRKQGQIVFISSLAAYFGLPETPSYSASKAAIKAYGEGLRGWLAPEGIKVNVVMPGYVKSPMCDAMPGPKPFLWTADKAAKVIKRGLSNNKARISFPFPLNIGTWFLAVLPASLSIKILSWIGYNGGYGE